MGSGAGLGILSVLFRARLERGGVAQPEGVELPRRVGLVPRGSGIGWDAPSGSERSGLARRGAGKQPGL